MWPLIVLTDERSAHAAGRAGQPVARARAGQRADDGRLGASRSLPVLLLFLALQRYYIEGLAPAASRDDDVARAHVARRRRAGMPPSPSSQWRLPQVDSAPMRRARSCSTISTTSRLWKAVASDGVSASIGAAVGRARAAGAASRFRPREDCRLRHRAALAAARAAGELRDLVLRARRGAGRTTSRSS